MRGPSPRRVAASSSGRAARCMRRCRISVPSSSSTRIPSRTRNNARRRGTRQRSRACAHSGQACRACSSVRVRPSRTSRGHASSLSREAKNAPAGRASSSSTVVRTTRDRDCSRPSSPRRSAPSASAPLVAPLSVSSIAKVGRAFWCVRAVRRSRAVNAAVPRSTSASTRRRKRASFTANCVD